MRSDARHGGNDAATLGRDARVGAIPVHGAPNVVDDGPRAAPATSERLSRPAHAGHRSRLRHACVVDNVAEDSSDGTPVAKRTLRWKRLLVFSNIGRWSEVAWRKDADGERCRRWHVRVRSRGRPVAVAPSMGATRHGPRAERLRRSSARPRDPGIGCGASVIDR